MDDNLEYIRGKIGAENCSPSCSRDGCKVYLGHIARNRVIANLDSKGLANFFTDSRRCDFVLFLEDRDGRMVIAPLELKHGKADAKDTAEQLQAGASFAETIIPESCRSVCRPILFLGRSLHPLEMRKFNQAKIKFHRLKLTIKIVKCGQPGNLARALFGGQAQPQSRRNR